MAEETNQRELLVNKLNSSVWKQAENITDDEISWLKSIPFEKCIGNEPSEKAMTLIIQAKRLSK